MQAIRNVALFLVLAGTLSAQDDKFEIFPARNGGAASGNTRPLPASAANVELLQSVPGTHFAGVGDDNTGTCSVTGFTMFTQDQNAATSETFNIIFRKNLPSGAPDTSPAGLLLRSADITLWGSGSGIASLNYGVTFATPVAIPCTGGFSFGIEFRAAPSWPGDGQSLWYADYAAGSAGDNPRAGAPTHTYFVAGGTATLNPAPIVLAVGLRSKSSCTNIGNLDPSTTRVPGKVSYGAGGMYPAVKAAPRDDGLMLRLLDTPNLGGSGHSFLSVGIGTVGYPFVPGVYGHIWLPPSPLLYVGSFSIDDDNGVGVGTVMLATPGTIPSATGIMLGFTTISINAGFANPRISNAQGVLF